MSKYRNIKTEIDGHVFDSKREAERYMALKAMLEVGEISNLVLQPKLPIVINGETICTYIADFKYDRDWQSPAGHTIYEDVKGVKTAVYRLKKKLVRSVYGIEIVEV